nr:hypothetical protein [Streptococcus equinus]
MLQPIVFFGLSQSYRFKKRDSKELLMKVRIGKIELSFFQVLNSKMVESILDKVLLYDNSIN